MGDFVVQIASAAVEEDGGVLNRPGTAEPPSGRRPGRWRSFFLGVTWSSGAENDNIRAATPSARGQPTLGMTAR